MKEKRIDHIPKMFTRQMASQCENLLAKKKFYPPMASKMALSAILVVTDKLIQDSFYLNKKASRKDRQTDQWMERILFHDQNCLKCRLSLSSRQKQGNQKQKNERLRKYVRSELAQMRQIRLMQQLRPVRQIRLMQQLRQTRQIRPMQQLWPVRQLWQMTVRPWTKKINQQMCFKLRLSKEAFLRHWARHNKDATR